MKRKLALFAALLVMTLVASAAPSTAGVAWVVEGKAWVDVTPGRFGANGDVSLSTTINYPERLRLRIVKTAGVDQVFVAGFVQCFKNDGNIVKRREFDKPVTLTNGSAYVRIPRPRMVNAQWCNLHVFVASSGDSVAYRLTAALQVRT